VGPRAGLYPVMKEKNSQPLLRLEPPIIQPVVLRYAKVPINMLKHCISNSSLSQWQRGLSHELPRHPRTLESRDWISLGALITSR
jgi:hypothetical protein